MPYFSSDANIYRGQARKIVLSESNIVNSSLDMNKQNITSVKEPVMPLDAANKIYVDSTVDKIAQNMENFFTGYEIQLRGTEYTDIVNMKSGSYFVTVTPVEEGFPTATFAISKSSTYQIGQIMRMTAHPGVYTKEQLELYWPSNGMISLRKTGPGYDGIFIVDFSTKNISSVSVPPVLPTDTATVAYVNQTIKDCLEVKYGGIQVNLQGIYYQNVINLRPGSYIISVSPINIEGAPTATFSVSKNSNTVDGFIMKITGCPGIYTPEQLEMVWKENEMLRIRKTGTGYDGIYLVDLNLKNFSNLPIPNIPTDAATMAYVDQQIDKKIQAKFGGEVVTLTDTRFTNVTHLRPGSYNVTVTPLVQGGPCATFAISKNSTYTEPSIMITTSCKGINSIEQLEMAWPTDSMLLLRKTGILFDGEYLVDFNLKNLSLLPSISTLPTDLASKEYVNHAIQQYLNVKFGAIEVILEDTIFSEVAALRPGSYVITVISYVERGPTASFNISKSLTSKAASIVKVTSSGGDITNENLELTWNENSKLLLRKTGPFYDGLYLVDFNLKNFSTISEPILPNDLASKIYVDDQIKRHLDEKFGGIEIYLSKTEYSSVAAKKPGTYFISISPVFDGGATAGFIVSKSSNYTEASIVRQTSSPAFETNEQLELIWPINSKIMIRKTSFAHDGTYIVDFNLRNFTNLPPPVFQSDIVDKAYVDYRISLQMEKLMKIITEEQTNS